MRNNLTHNCGWLVAVLAGLLKADAAFIATESSFQNEISPGFYLNEFDDLPDHSDTPGSMGVDSPKIYSGGSPLFAYRITALSGDLYGVTPGGDKAISTVDSADTLVVSFTSGNVRAFGGKFFLTDDPGNFFAGNPLVTVKLSDGSSRSPSSFLGDFLGFSTGSTGPVITSLTLSFIDLGAGPGGYPTMDHLFVATVPEPASAITGVLLLLPFGVIALRLIRRKYVS